MNLFRFALLLLLLSAMVGTVSARDPIYQLIADGKIREATDSLSRYTTAANRDGNILFFQSLIETDAGTSARLMEAALRTDIDMEYREEVHFRLAQYYFVSGQYKDMARVVNEYRTRWESGRYDREMRRLSVIADEKNGAIDRALDQVDRYLVRYDEGEAEQWGEIDKARLMLASNKEIGAVKLLRSQSRQSRGPGVPQALYLLAQQAYKDRQFDDAVFFYNILREGYPSSVGLDALIEELGNISERAAQDNTAEQLTGTFYSVKVGVFSEKDNAKRQQEIFRAYGKQVDIQTKNISGKRYHVVYVGEFPSYYDATVFKSKLEANHSEVYQVVAR